MEKERINRNLNRFSSREDKKSQSDVVFDNLADALLDRVNYVSNPFSNNGENYTGTSDYRGWSRITDTSKGKFYGAGSPSRMRCMFYLYTPPKVEGYILSPAVYNDTTSLNTITSVSSDIDAYVGIKVVSQSVYACRKNYGGAEELFDTGVTMPGTSFSETKSLEIEYSGRHADIYIDSALVWTGNIDLGWETVTTEAFLPLLSPVRSTDGTAADITIENYQYIQKRT